MKSTIVIFLLLFCFSGMAAAQDIGGKADKYVQKIAYLKHPKLSALKTAQPFYPRDALSRYKEGYVLINFTIDKNGKVVNPVVVESTSNVFNKPSLKAAKHLEYPPQTKGGEPIEVNHYYKFTFEITEGYGDLSRSFTKEFTNFKKQFESGRLEGIKNSLSMLQPNLSKDRVYLNLANYLYQAEFKKDEFMQMYYLNLAVSSQEEMKYEYYSPERSNQLHLVEVFRYQVSRRDLRISNGRDAVLIESSQTSTIKPKPLKNYAYAERNDFLIPKEFLEAYLMKLLGLQMNNGFLEEALHTIKKIERVGLQNKKVSSLRNSIIQVKNSDDQYSVNMRFNAKGYVDILLFRRGFNILVDQDEIESVKLDCDHGSADFLFSGGNDYAIPEHWGDCQITIKGEPGASLVFNQL